MRKIQGKNNDMGKEEENCKRDILELVSRGGIKCNGFSCSSIGTGMKAERMGTEAG